MYFIPIVMVNDTLSDNEILVRQDECIREPEEYVVILLNDDYTTMDFVVEILMIVFHKDMRMAVNIMLDVHCKGRGVVGIYPFDIAVTKIEQVHQLAKTRGFPLRCSIEKA